MQNENDKGKAFLVFIFGVLVVGLITFILISKTGTSEPNYEDPGKNLASNLNEVQKQPVEEDSDTELTQEIFNSSNSRKEAKDMPEQKLTVEQKLAVKAPVDTIDLNKSYLATLKTSMGNIVIALDTKNRPQTVNSFIYLSRMGFYDGVVFHRVISDFMIQGGDPTGTGMGGPGYKFADELSSSNSNSKGTISMANSGPNTNGSQFFINLVDNNYLDGKHSVFGKVTQGMEVVEAIGKVQTGAGDKPVTPVIIESIEVVEE